MMAARAAPRGVLLETSNEPPKGAGMSLALSRGACTDAKDSAVRVTPKKLFATRACCGGLHAPGWP